MSKRTKQISQLIKNRLGEIINKELELPEGGFITITRVEVAPDLKSANVWVSIFPTELKTKILNILRKNVKKLQNLLAEKSTTKFAQKLFFRIDRTEEQAEEVEKILDEIKSGKR